MRFAALIAGVAATFGSCCAPALAQEPAPASVSANDPQGVLSVLKAAGYEAKLVERGEENASTYIEIETASGTHSVNFSDCDEAVPDFCETLVLMTWWDRQTPISDEAIAAANRNHKYVSVYRANDGDPIMQWAILTRREGVPATLFLNALQRFSAVARDFQDVAFEGDDAGETPPGPVEAAE